MQRRLKPAGVSGTVRIPGSKSHTIRALLIASFAQGQSEIIHPLESSDTASARELCRALGASIQEETERWIVQGFGSGPQGAKIDVGNSGTTLYLAAAMAAAGERKIRFDGDHQIRRRSAAPLLTALRGLGAEVEEEGAPGCAPFSVQGPLEGGKISISCPTSQYLSALLLASPLAAEGSLTEIEVPLLYERPYLEMTAAWLDSQGINYRRDGVRSFSIPGGQSYRPFCREIGGDYSSASFFFAAPAITGGSLELSGLDPEDVQGDKRVLEILRSMGCEIRVSAEVIRVTAPPRGLEGGSFNLNDIPDALPVLSVCACFALGETRLIGVPQARIKETDRIAVMARELTKLGAEIRELDEGLIIRGKGPGSLTGGKVCGHGDHRVIMSLAVASLAAAGELCIDEDKAVEVTFPSFFKLLESIKKT